MAGLDFDTLEVLQREHPGWRLLRSDHAPLIVSFLHRAFIEPNVRTIPEPELTEGLENSLFTLREQRGPDAFPRTARDYLVDWASPAKGFLRRFYLRGTDEPHYDLVPATERVIAWLGQLEARSFVGTESRLLTLFELLRQMVLGSEADPTERVAELQKRRDALDGEIQRAMAGEAPLLDDTSMRDRFQQFTQIARDLLSDFREVEQNFRTLDRSVRERIALWEGGKAELLDEIFGQRDGIEDSDQGRSFRAFWDFLMSDSRQQELGALIETILAHPAIRADEPDPRLRRVHYDWLQAGDHTQRTIADLSRQLRRFLDDQAWLENRRIMDLLHGIESKSLALRDKAPSSHCFMEIAETGATIRLPLERPLFKPGFRPSLAADILAASGEDIDASALFAVRFVDKEALRTHIRQSLQTRAQVSLRELTETRPLEQGLAELIAYFEIASTGQKVLIDESAEETLCWSVDDEGDGRLVRSARLSRVIFLR